MENNEKKNICSACKGACCKRMSGIVNPKQLGEITVDKIKEYLDNGYQFDYWEGNPTNNSEYDNKTFYYLRPSLTNSTHKKVDGSWGGTCVFLTDTGCSKTFEERPEGCQALLPQENFNCNSQYYSKEEYCEMWFKYNDIIEKALNSYYE